MAQKHAATDTAAEAGLAKALSTGTVLCLEGIEPKSLLPGKTNKQTSPNPSDICLFPRKIINVGEKKKKARHFQYHPVLLVALVQEMISLLKIREPSQAVAQ